MGKEEVMIVTGGLLTESILPFIKKSAIVIGVDRGAEWLIIHGIVPDYIVGDFDSVDTSFFEKVKTQYADRIHQSPAEKDETDTELAVQLALTLNIKRITLLGGIGTRLDHVIANIHVLLQAAEKNVEAVMIGGNNRIQILLPGQRKIIDKSKYTYVSLIPFSDQVEGLTISGFKYPLQNAVMKLGIPYGISNELVEEKGTISILKGILLIIESKD
ncbi:thiamine diphosphokinase [Tepidibacillus infernus]|uniref:thiamine diphosphokinase n=1 Tax=Tepidibacillus TaxID=1494427 RepID=UPI00085331AB|nr:thiamine diphosphokinase [Tepidibacillus sp. HK-1]GBF12198.1 thiamine pyrophosphokinase [Tepidibacillus sp. HK-1]